MTDSEDSNAQAEASASVTTGNGGGSESSTPDLSKSQKEHASYSAEQAAASAQQAAASADQAASSAKFAHQSAETVAQNVHECDKIRKVVLDVAAKVTASADSSGDKDPSGGPQRFNAALRKGNPNASKDDSGEASDSSGDKDPSGGPDATPHDENPRDRKGPHGGAAPGPSSNKDLSGGPDATPRDENPPREAGATWLTVASPTSEVLREMSQLNSLLLGSSPAFAEAVRQQTAALTAGLSGLNAVSDQQRQNAIALAIMARSAATALDAGHCPPMPNNSQKTGS